MNPPYIKAIHFRFCPNQFASTLTGYLLAFLYRLLSLSDLDRFVVGEKIYVFDGSILQAGWLLASREAFMDAFIFAIVGSFIWLVFVRPAAKGKT